MSFRNAIYRFLLCHFCLLRSLHFTNKGGKKKSACCNSDWSTSMFIKQVGDHLTLPKWQTFKDTLEQLQNTPQLIYMSLNKNSVYCVMPRSSKPPDTCKWGGNELRGILKFSQSICPYLMSESRTRGFVVVSPGALRWSRGQQDLFNLQNFSNWSAFVDGTTITLTYNRPRNDAAVFRPFTAIILLAMFLIFQSTKDL